ncbi:SMC5-SMC6 complex localization factor protein 1 [Aplochiton taeniatus]
MGGSTYSEASTHLVIDRTLPGEKFLAACAAGKWIVTPQYVLDSVKNGSWLPEEPYELAVSTATSTASYPARKWREKVSSGALTGAFQGWQVLLLIDQPSSWDTFQRILKAGKAKVYCNPVPSHATVTHVLTKHVTEGVKSCIAPCWSVKYITMHLFGNLCPNMDMPCEGQQPTQPTQSKPINIAVFTELEIELKDYASKLEGRNRLVFPEFLSHSAPSPRSQAVSADYSNLGSLIECGFFTTAVEEVQSTLVPGLLPPAPCLASLMQHALQGDASMHFIGLLENVLHELLCNNPPRGSPGTAKFFTQLLQCPQCKGGLWPFLQTSFRYCMFSEDTCHPLPCPASPERLRFHSDLQTLVRELFQWELHSSSTGETLVSRSSVLYGSFWGVWERSTLPSRHVQQLAQLLIQATEQIVSEVNPAERDRRQKLVLTLQDLLSAVVEFWCQQHRKLNRALVDKGLEDLAQHIAILCQDLSPEALTELVPNMPSSRLRMATAGAIFRHLCLRNGVAMEAQPVTLKNTSPDSCRSASLQAQSSRQGGTGPGKVSLIRGLNRVNAAGETLLHRACRRNQVETLHRILALPGTDINVEDHAGWTPLHEACNHGNSACVEALLGHRPAPQLNRQVGGVSPLHDALIAGHIAIAKMLLEHAGSSLLEQTDGNGRTPLDLVTTATLKEELRRSALAGNAAILEEGSEVRDLPFLEACSCLLACLLCCYHEERGILCLPQPHHGALSLGHKLARALGEHSFLGVTSGWANRCALRLAEDTAVAMALGGYLEKVSTAVRECQGPHTRFLLTLLEELKTEGDSWTHTHTPST